MAGGKYIIAASENQLQISIRNILSPNGYIFLSNCSDSMSLIRLVRTYHPDFIIIDVGVHLSDYKNTLETIDDEMLCSCIIIGDYQIDAISHHLENSKVIYFCAKPIDRNILMNTMEMASINFKRVFELEKKLKEMTENYETRKSVERAKWILMNRDKMNEKDAYDRIRKKSMDSRMSMKEVADAIIFTNDITAK